MKKKEILILVCVGLCLAAVCGVLIYTWYVGNNNTYEEYQVVVPPASDDEILYQYLIDNKDELISYGVSSSFFDNIHYTTYTPGVYYIFAGKSISIGIENGEVTFCNVY